MSLPEQDPNRLKLAKKFNFAQLSEVDGVDYLAVDTYVDAKDTVSNWCVAIVKGINHDEKTVRLGFEGWSYKYDIEIKRNSAKIAPFRTHTLGYTGQKKTAYRDFKITATYMAHMEKRVKELTDSNFMSFSSAYECTQFMRGELYYYVDSLLTLSLNINQEDLPSIFNFIELVFRMTLQWYEILPNCVSAWKEAQVTPNLMNVDLQAALSLCGYELSQIFGKMWGICKRAKTFFQQFKTDYLCEGPFCKEEQNAANGFLGSLTNKFGQLGGFKKIIAFTQKDGIPLTLITTVLSQLKYLNFFVVSSECKEFGKNISQSLSKRLTTITNQELKETDRDVMRRTIQCVEQYTRMHNSQTAVGQISENLELKIAFQYLKSPFFELKLRGMNDFKNIFSRVQNRAQNTDEQLRAKDIEFCYYLTYQLYQNFLNDNNVLESIYTESPHPELIKRSLEMLFMRTTDKKNIPDGKLIDVIWKCCTERHEAVGKAAFTVLQDLIQYVPIPFLELVWQRVKTLENEEFDDMRVQFLKNYTIGALAALKRQFDSLISANPNPNASSKQGSSQSVGFFNSKDKNSGKKTSIPNIQSQNYLNLVIFWKIAEEEGNLANQKTKDFAIQALIEILPGLSQFQLQNLQNRLDFLKIAMGNLKGGSSVQTSILFIRRILKTFQLDNTSTQKYSGTTTQNNHVGDNSTRERVISYLISEKIYDLVLANAESYMKSVQSLQGFTVDSKVPGSPFAHHERIDAIMDLIEFLIVNSKASNLDFQQLSNLYNTFVAQAVTPYENEAFFKFLTKENENSSTRERKYLLDERRTTQVFQQIICNQDMLDCSKLGRTGFNCFKLLFLNVNAQTRLLDIDVKGHFQVLKLAQLQGFDTLWQIAIFSTEASVRDQARNFLVDLYLNCKVSDKHKKDITDSFLIKLDQVFSKLTPALHTHWLKVITTFIKRFDFEHIQEQSLSQFDKNYSMEIQVTLMPQQLNHTVLVNSNMRIWQLIIQIGKAYKMKCSEFRIDTNNGLLDTTIYNDLISVYNISSIRIKRIEEKILDKESPRRIIAQNSELICKMLDSITPKSKQQIQEVTVQETFDLIEELPFNLENRLAILLEISKFKTQGKSADFGPWCTLFQVNQTLLRGCNSLESISPQTCYNLILLQDLILSRSQSNSYNLTKDQLATEKQEKKQFCIQFVDKGGFSFLLEFFNVLSKDNLEKQVLKCCALQALQKLIIYLINNYYDPNRTQGVIKTLFEQNLLLVQSLTQSIILHGQATRRDLVLTELTLKQIQKIVFLDPLLINQLYHFPGFDLTLLQIYTQLTDQNIQAKVSECLFQICCQIDFTCLEKAGLVLGSFQEQALALPTFYFFKLIIKQMIPATLDNKTNTSITQQLFNFTNNLLTETEVYKWLHVIEPVQTLVGDLAAMIKSRPILEMQAKTTDEDVVLGGLMSTLTNILAVRPQVKHQMPIRNSLIKYLLHDCLFLKETKRALLSKNQPTPPKCKTTTSRQKCLGLIRELCVENEAGIAMFVSYLRDDVFGNNVSWFWRTPRKSDWQITAENKHERASTGYVGLKNIGCICYMNSILQQLYMIPTFRKAMLEVWDKNNSTDPKAENSLYQIKRMFAGLMQLGKQYYNPKKFCFSFKDIDGSPIDPWVQKDCDEFFIMLIDRIENMIKGTKEELVMKNLMYGVFANELICKGCPHTSEREEPFMAVQIQVKDKNSIQEGLDAFVQGEMLEGDNAYFCEKCDKKRDTLRRQTIKRLPNTLFLNLKRFEFNYDTMSKVKINDNCEFPTVLDMNKYTQDYIKRQDLLREMDEKNQSYDELDQDRQAIYNRQQCDEYSQYALAGIVVHQGTAESGHYYSFIKEREGDGQWFEFNDKEVNPFNPDNIPGECFGGEDKEFDYKVSQFSHDAQMQHAIAQQGRIKTKNAYILIYERNFTIDQTRFHEFVDDNSIALVKGADKTYQQQSLNMYTACKVADAPTTSIQIQPEIFQEIQEKNGRFWLTKHIFNKQFMEQSYEIFCLKELPPNLDYIKFRQTSAADIVPNQDQTIMVYKFIVTFLLTVAQRSLARGQIPSFVKIIRKALKNNLGLSLWLCEMFSCQAIIKEFLIDCPIQDMSRFVAGLLNTAMQTIYQHEKRGILRYIESMPELDDFITSTQGNLVKSTSVHASSAVKLRSFEDQPAPVFTPNQHAKIYKMQGLTQELPTLIVMINSFLHYQSSPVMLENYNYLMSAQFQRVISSFAELGPETSLYLLHTGCLHRFLKLVLHQKVETDRKMNEIPLFHFEVPSRELYLTRNQSSSLDTKVPVADRKNAVNNSIQPAIFIHRAISIIIRYCSTANQRSTAEHTLYTMEKAEIELLVHEVANRNWWRSATLDHPVARNAISKIWVTLCHNDNQQSQIYLKQIFTQISDTNFQTIKRFERLILDLLSIQDPYQNERINRVLNQLYEALKKNTQFWKTTDSLIELILKLTERCRPFALELKKNQNVIRLIERFTYECPSYPMVSGPMKLFKDYIINWAAFPQSHKYMVTEAKVNALSNYSKQRFLNLQEALKAQVNSSYESSKDDSDDDCYSCEFKEGDIVDAKFSKPNLQGWFEAEIVVALDEMVRVKIISPQRNNSTTHVESNVTCQWIEKESYRLAKKGSQINNEKSIYHSYFQDLMRLFEQQPNIATHSQEDMSKLSARS